MLVLMGQLITSCIYLYLGVQGYADAGADGDGHGPVPWFLPGGAQSRSGGVSTVLVL